MAATNERKRNKGITMSDDEILKFNITVTYQQYYNSDSTWGVYGFSTEDDIPYYEKQTTSPFDDVKPKDNLKFSKLAGKMQELVVGGKYTVKATYKKDKNYGDQYNPIAVYAIAPQTEEDQLLFLKSVISESLAENLVKAYPNIVNDVITGTVKEIDYNKVKGIRQFTWERIKETIMNNYLISDIIIMLKPLGVTYAMIKKLLSDEPNPALLKKQLEDNPWTVTRISGIGFSKADSLALKLKPEMYKSTERLVAFINWYLRDIGEGDGHTWVSLTLLKNAVDCNVSECSEMLDWLLENNDFLHVCDDKVGLQYYYDIEQKIVDILCKKSKIKCSFELDPNKNEEGIRKAENDQGFEYVESQLNVINQSLNRQVSIITGQAGSGKTSIMRGIINAYLANKHSVSACALSAMAAKRITEATGYPAMTIHRTLGCVGLNSFTFNKDNHMIVDVAFMDEGSMVNARLFLNWLEAIDDNTRIIISGDHKQLPPIGYGNVFSDIIEIMGKNVVSKLTEPMRQAKLSGILTDANMIRNNISPIGGDFEPKIVRGELKDMYYMFRTNRQSLFDIATKTFLKSVETDGLDNVVIIVPRRQGCLNSTQEINKYIQEQLLGDVLEEIKYYENSFKLGAKVMQTVNDYQKNVFNGEIGYIIEINTRYEGNKSQQYCVVLFTDSDGKEKRIEYTPKELTSLDLAYALTTHKAQGSGYNTVIGIIDNTHYTLLDNCILYTLITRAKKRCLLLAEPQAYLQCIRTSHNRRNTWLSLKKSD